ncbi:unnamed protein product [Acanthoscelides obtectus]|uniref:GILT-like protein 1 n=1 Tax=Acanthoscelides obtectus TaxID=200917 RepID=A0A9P0NXD9_ACAOB|nr:unnamed protein product [Acanthoscelides obtectus]CAK1661785.1 GILT-like protein 1 [Acanthoscelides obtectus]
MFKLASVLLLAVCIDAGTTQNVKLGVEVMIESLCPDTFRFMKDLSQSFPALAKYLDLSIIPFGKSNSYNNGTSIDFQCQHGPRECTGNKIISCALNRLADQNAKVQFTYCFMFSYYIKHYMNQSDDFTKCTKDAGIDINDVLVCSLSDEANLLQLQMEKITKNYSITFVPTIVYNKQFSSYLQDKSLLSFKATVCEILHKNSVVAPECIS